MVFLIEFMSNKEFGCSQIDISVLISSQPKERMIIKKNDKKYRATKIEKLSMTKLWVT